MPLFLWHTVGFATFYAAYYAVGDVPDSPSTTFWITRPLWFVGPALATLPLLALSRAATSSRSRRPVPVPA
jgi:hypothetical protein